MKTEILKFVSGIVFYVGLFLFGVLAGGCASESEFESFKFWTENDRKWQSEELMALRAAVHELQRGHTVKVITVTVTNEVHDIYKK